MNKKLEIIDSHFHIWDLKRQNLPWLKGIDKLNRSYSIDDYTKIYEKFADISFLGGVYVEVDSDDPILEDEIIYDIYKNTDKILALVPRVEVSPKMRIPVFACGIREPLHIPTAEKGKCTKDFFVEGIDSLTKKGFSFDSCNRVRELDDLVKMMKRVPEAKVVLNHLGNVEKLDEEYKKNMTELAKFPNLYLKVSGFATMDKNFVKELLKFVKETFRADRLMYASNWPVVELYSSFDEHLNILLEEFKDDEDFFKNNAIRCYNIEKQ